MDIDIEEAVTYPTESDDWVVTVLIGGVLTLFSFLLFPIFLVTGYVVSVIRAGIADDPEPPTFNDWGTLLVEGFVGFVVTLVYQLVPLIVFGVTVGGSILALLTGSDVGAGLGIFGLLGGMSLGVLLSLAFGYFGVIGLANYAHERRFGAAFDVGVVRSVAFDGAYAVPFLYGVVLLIVAGILTSVLSFVPLLGQIVGVFVAFYAQIAAARLWGLGYAASRDLTAGRDSEVDDAAPVA